MVAGAKAQPPKPAEFVGVEAGFAGRYKVGLWTPIEVSLRGGSSPVVGRVRASTTDSDGVNCSFESPEPCRLLPGEETKVPLFVRFGHEAGTLALELLDADGRTTLAAKSIDSALSGETDHFRNSLRGGQRLIVFVGKDALAIEKAVPGAQGPAAVNAIAAVDSIWRLPARPQGYEGVDLLLISTSSPEIFVNLKRNDSRLEALDEWVRGGGTLVLCAGARAEEAIGAKSPLARFLPGRFEKTVYLRQTSGWETYAKSVNPMPPPQGGGKLELPTARLTEVQGRIEAREGDLPLVVRRPQGLGQVVFVATDLDRGPILDWADRSSLLGAVLGLPANEQTGSEQRPVESYGYNDLAGQLRSALEVPRDVRQAPFFAVAGLVIVYVLLIGPGDYYLLRRMGRGVQWTWLTFPAIVVLFAAGSYAAACWLKGNELRVSQLDLVDIDAEGTARGACWFSVFSPREQTFDLSVRPRLPGGLSPREQEMSLAWFGKAGDEFNGMYTRDTQNSAPLGGQGYSIAPTLGSVRGAPIQVWSSKSFVCRWLGRAPELGLYVVLKDDDGQLSGMIANHLTTGEGGQGIALTHCFLAYDNWVYEIGALRPGEAVDIGAATRRVSLKTFLSGDVLEDARDSLGAEASASKTEKGLYDRGSRDMAYVLQAMLFYDAAGGSKRTGMDNSYQGFTDLSGLLKAGRAILVAMPPQDGSSCGGELLRGPPPQPGETDNRRPLGNARDRHTTIYRFVLPVATPQVP